MIEGEIAREPGINYLSRQKSGFPEFQRDSQKTLSYIHEKKSFAVGISDTTVSPVYSFSWTVGTAN
jgi:hypothetical protein